MSVACKLYCNAFGGLSFVAEAGGLASVAPPSVKGGLRQNVLLLDLRESGELYYSQTLT